MAHAYSSSQYITAEKIQYLYLDDSPFLSLIERSEVLFELDCLRSVPAVDESRLFC